MKSITPLKSFSTPTDHSKGTTDQMLNYREISSFDGKQHNINNNNSNQWLSTSLQNNRNHFKNDYTSKEMDDITGKAN